MGKSTQYSKVLISARCKIYEGMEGYREEEDDLHLGVSRRSLRTRQNMAKGNLIKKKKDSHTKSWCLDRAQHEEDKEVQCMA